MCLKIAIDHGVEKQNFINVHFLSKTHSIQQNKAIIRSVETLIKSG